MQEIGAYHVLVNNYENELVRTLNNFTPGDIIAGAHGLIYQTISRICCSVNSTFDTFIMAVIEYLKSNDFNEHPKLLKPLYFFRIAIDDFVKTLSEYGHFYAFNIQYLRSQTSTIFALYIQLMEISCDIYFTKLVQLNHNTPL